MLSLDHIVISSSNIEEAARKFRKEFSIETTKGGQHDVWGTYNHLAYFANDCYIEWLGMKDADVARHSDNPLIRHFVHIMDNDRHGSFQFALRTDRVDEFVSHFQNEKIPFVGPVEGKRRKPDGKLLTWRMLFPAYDFQKETLPFLIEWDQSEEERYDANLVNGKNISALHYSGTSSKQFARIYMLEATQTKKIELNNADILFGRAKLKVEIN